MSEPENFLARWSRRKAKVGREAPGEPAPQAELDPAKPVDAATASAAKNKDEAKQEGEVDLSKLPSLDSIDAGTDIRAFLQKGVPADLARAALRRVWAADPAIRNFIGIAENQYDFATGSDIPGFGPLTPEDDVARMIAQISSEGMPRPPTLSDAESGPVPEKSETAERQDMPAEDMTAQNAAAESAPAIEVEPSQPFDVATQQNADEDTEDSPAAPRSHGGALPQ